MSRTLGYGILHMMLSYALACYRPEASTRLFLFVRNKGVMVSLDLHRTSETYHDVHPKRVA